MHSSLIATYKLEVCHHLTDGVPERHKCRRLHGHGYKLEIEIGGMLDSHGMLIEYDELRRVIGPIVALVDHHDLNTLNERCSTVEAGKVAENPTVERLAAWFGVRLAVLESARPGQGLFVRELLLRETDDVASVWRP